MKLIKRYKRTDTMDLLHENSSVIITDEQLKMQLESPMYWALSTGGCKAVYVGGYKFELLTKNSNV